MTARHKLNSFHFQAAAAFAGLIALVSGSWPVFVVILVVLILSSLHNGDIRLR